MTLADRRDTGRWGDAETLAMTSTSSRRKARSRDTKPSLERVMWIVSHLSESASVQTHVDGSLFGRGGLTECVQEVLVFTRRYADLGADKDGRATSTSRQVSYL